MCVCIYIYVKLYEEKIEKSQWFCNDNINYKINVSRNSQ